MRRKRGAVGSGNALFSPYGQLARKDLPGGDLPVATRTAVPRKLKITRHMPHGTGRERGVAGSLRICPGSPGRVRVPGSGPSNNSPPSPTFPAPRGEGRCRGNEGSGGEGWHMCSPAQQQSSRRGRANGCFSCSVSPSTSTPPRVLKLQLLTASVFKENVMLSVNRRKSLLAGRQHGHWSRQGRLLREVRAFQGRDPKAITFGMQTQSRL